MARDIPEWLWMASKMRPSSRSSSSARAPTEGEDTATRLKDWSSALQPPTAQLKMARVGAVEPLFEAVAGALAARRGAVSQSAETAQVALNRTGEESALAAEAVGSVGHGLVEMAQEICKDSERLHHDVNDGSRALEREADRDHNGRASGRRSAA